MTQVLKLLCLVFVGLSPAWGQTTETNESAQNASAVPADSAAELEIRNILQQDVKSAMSLESASARSQIAHFEQNYASGYISVGSNGTVYSLGDILKGIREKGPNNQKFSSVEMKDTQVLIHGDTAVATYIMSYSWQSEGQPSNRSIRESAVFVRRDGRWLRILEQRGNVTGPSQ